MLRKSPYLKLISKEARGSVRHLGCYIDFDEVFLTGLAIARRDSDVMAELYVSRIYTSNILNVGYRDPPHRAKALSLFKKVLTYFPTVEEDLAFYALNQDVATALTKFVSGFSWY